MYLCLVHCNLGIAKSFLKAARVSRTRRAHQITFSALYISKSRAYDRYGSAFENDEEIKLDFEQWCKEKKQSCPQFNYWASVMDLKLCLLVYVRSLRRASF